MRRQRIFGLAWAAALFTGLAPAASVATAQGVAATGPIGVIDVGRLLQESEAGKAAVEAVRQMQIAKTAEGEAVQASAQQLKDRIDRGSLSLTEDALAVLQKEFEDKVIELQRFQDDAKRELQQAEQAAFGELQKKVMPVIFEVGKNGGFSLLLNKFDSGLVYASEAADVTDLILDRFNAMTAAEAAQAPPAQGK